MAVLSSYVSRWVLLVFAAKAVEVGVGLHGDHDNPRRFAINNKDKTQCQFWILPRMVSVHQIRWVVISLQIISPVRKQEHVLPAGEQLPLGEGEGGQAAAAVIRGVTSPSISPATKNVSAFHSRTHTHNTRFAFYG